MKEWDTPEARAKYNYVSKNPPNNQYKQSSSENNTYYQKPTDWGAYYDAEVQRSNEQRRQNLNNQAREWNEYARQKANRGW